MDITRPTVMEVDTSAFLENINSIKKLIPENTKIMPVIKANGYGTYINTRLEILNNFDIVAVATVDEAVFIRSLGYQKEIFILNQPDIKEIQKIIENGITVGVCSKEFIKELEKYEEVKIHIEIETGMGRTGVKLEELEEFINSLNSNVKIEGLYTHFSSADSDFEYTKNQIEIFEKAIEIVKSKNINLKYIHSHASNGILNFGKNGNYNLVRPGIIMYGYPSDIEACKKIELKPITKLKSKITFLKTVESNTSVSYGRNFITEKETKIATVPIGYADGLRRSLSNKGEVVINGKKAKIIGNVCMDSIMIDVTDIENVKTGDEVYIWDNEIIKLEDVSKLCDTINYEILSGISSRVPRIFK